MDVCLIGLCPILIIDFWMSELGLCLPVGGSAGFGAWSYFIFNLYKISFYFAIYIADEQAISNSSNNVIDLIADINFELVQLRLWFNAHQMCIRNKPKLMFFFLFW